MGTLDAAVARLEAVADRLEALQFQGNGANQTAPSRSAPSAAAPPAPTNSTSSTNDILSAYQSLLDSHIPQLTSTAEAIGGEILSATRLFVDAFQKERNIVEAIATCQKPSIPELQTLLQPVGEKMMQVGDLSSGPRSPYVNHFKLLGEAVQALSWVAFTGPGCGMDLPAKHVENTWSAAEFYANKVLMEWKTKDPNHPPWVVSVKEIITALKGYCSRYFPAGPAWNAAGIPVGQFKPGAAAAAPVSSNTASKPAQQPPAAAAAAAKLKAGPPPPPPPPPGGLHGLMQAKPGPAPAASAGAGNGGAAGGNPMAALFAEINKGEGVTKGLRKVTDDMKTKNRTDRSGVVPVAAPTAGTAPPSATGGGKSNGPPRVECEQGRKWVIENHVGNREIIITDTEPKQSVYIFNCSNSTIQITGKVNAITLDNCKRCGLLFDTVVSSCEIVNCASVDVQCTGTAPTVAVDKTDGCQLYLSRDSLHADITTAKSSEVNVVIPGATEEDDPVESAIPEQFVTRYVGGKFVTESVSHSGG